MKLKTFRISLDFKAVSKGRVVKSALPQILLGIAYLACFFLDNRDCQLAILPAVAAGVSIASGIAGFLSNSSAAERAEALQQEGIQKWIQLSIPDPAKQKLALEQFVVAGKLTPDLERAVKQDPSAFESIVADRGLRESRMRGLRAMEDLGTGKETYEDRAAQQEAMIEENARARGKSKAIMSDLAQRGQMGSGLELAGRLDQAQADADRAATNSLGLERDRRARGFQAIESAANMAGDIAEDDYKMASDKARASDAIDAFNTQNLRDVISRNTQIINDAKKANLEREQAVADKNVGVRNYEQEYNKGLLQKDFNNQVTKTAGITGQYKDSANQTIASGKTGADFWGSIAGNAPKVFDATAKYLEDEEKKKKAA